jgi:phospholipid/cholesterol/gamma-HCH transport system substrate-binding protein
MKNQRAINLKVGIFVLVSLFIFVVFVFALGRESTFFKKSFKVQTSFTNTAGLSEGAPVRLSGLRIGSVKEIKFPESPDNNFIIVSMDVTQEGIRRIGSDAIATIRTEGLLGDKYIEILKGTTNLPEKIPDVVRIKSYTPPELEKLLGQSEELVNNITSISQNLDELVKAFNKEENIQNISKSLASLRRTLDGIEAEQKSSETTLKKIDSAVAALNVLLAEVKTGNGVLNALFYDKNLRAKLDQAIANVNSVAEEIGGDGGIATELKKTVSNLKEISEKLNGGEGTLGALINDPALYDEVKGLVGESQRSKFVRTAVRYLIDNKGKESDQKK